MFMPNALVGFWYSKLEIGIIYSAAPFMRFLLPFVFKYYVELTHRIYFFALLLTFLSAILFLISIDNFYIHLIANLFFGGAMGIILPFVETISLQKLTKAMYGKIRLWGSVGFIVIALWLGKIEVSSLETIYYLIAMGLFTFIFGYYVLQFDTHKEENSSSDDKSFSLKKYWAFWISMFLMQVAFGGFYTFFTIYESSQGLDAQLISYLWSFGVICEIVMLYFQGALLQRNLLTILKVATLITAFRWFLLYLYPDSLTLTFLGQSMHAVSFALYHTAAITYVFSLYTQKRLAQQFFLGISFGLGGSFGAFLAGYLYGEYLFLMEGFITLGAFLMLLVHTKRKNQRVTL